MARKYPIDTGFDISSLPCSLVVDFAPHPLTAGVYPQEQVFTDLAKLEAVMMDTGHFTQHDILSLRKQVREMADLGQAFIAALTRNEDCTRVYLEISYTKV